MALDIAANMMALSMTDRTPFNPLGKELPRDLLAARLRLPVSSSSDEIVAMIQEHQVLIVTSGTGSGKSTQIPGFALYALGDKDGKRIACTQPRRLAASSVATRVAEENGVRLGAEVGFKFRGTDETHKEVTRIW
jgi:HrpA-like RNA helicase